MTETGKPDSQSKEKEPKEGTSHFVVLDEGKPKAFLFMKDANVPEMYLPNQSPEEVCNQINQLLNLREYKIEEDNGRVSYYRKKDTSGPLSFLKIKGWKNSSTSLTLSTTFEFNGSDRKQKQFFWQIASRFYQNPEFTPLSDWEVKTVADLKFLSFMADTASKKEDFKEKIKKTSVEIPKDDENFTYVLDLAGLDKIEKVIYFTLDPNTPQTGVRMIEGKPETICVFPEKDFHSKSSYLAKWAIAISLGYSLKGKEFDFDTKMYREKRDLSDRTFAYFTCSSDSDWNPRNYLLESLEELYRPPIQLLSLIWELWAEGDERRQVIRALWQHDFGANQEDFEKAEEFIRNFKPQK